MMKLKLKDFTKPLDKMSPEALRRGCLLWLEGGDEASANEHARLLTEAVKNGTKLPKD
jgi:hypothetical protein